MKRVLIITPRNAYATKRFLEEAIGLAVVVDCIDVHSLAQNAWRVDIAQYDCVWVRQVFPYYPEVIGLAREFAKQGKGVIDSAIPKTGIEDNKYAMLVQLRAGGIPMPQTVLASERVVAQMSYPCVLKWVYGFGARYVHFVENEKAFTVVSNQYQAKETMLQEYISAQYEYKVHTVGYRCIPWVVRYRIHPEKKVADLGSFQVFSPEQVPEVVSLAERASRLLQRELAKSDILECNGKLFLLEVNRTPGLEPVEKATGENVAQFFLQYIQNSCIKSE